jgi:urease accessory protein
MASRMTEPTTTNDGTPALPELPLLIWLSPAFPIGGFAYSHGLEWAHESGKVTDAASLRSWLADIIAFGAPRNDAILLAASWCAAQLDDAGKLVELNALALALAGSRERYLETSTQGNAFAAAVRAAWPSDTLYYPQIHDDLAYPVSVGIAAAGHRLALAATLEAFVVSVVVQLVSAAVRLGSIGQTDAQQVIAALVPDCRAVAAFAASSGPEDLGSAAWHSDLCSLNHETQYTRLFRS